MPVARAPLPSAALRRVFSQELRRRWSSRFATLAAAVCVVGSGTAMVFLSDHRIRMALTANTLLWLSCSAAPLAALAGARLMDPKARSSTLCELLEFAGFDRAAQRNAAVMVTATRIARVLAVPTLLLGLLAIATAPTMAAVLGIGALLGLLVVYIALLAVALTALAIWSRRASGSSFLLFFAVLVLPEFARQIWPSTPTLLRAFSWLLDQAAMIGASIA